MASRQQDGAQASPVTRLPALDRRRILGWLDSHRVIALPDETDSREEALDLDTGRAFPLSSLPVRDRRRWQETGISRPYVSPDGRWLLFSEAYFGKPGDPLPIDGTEPVRFRLTPVQGGPVRLVPADGMFAFPAVGYLVWLPGSDGWLALRRGKGGALSLTRHLLRAPEVAQRLPVASGTRYPPIEPYDANVALAVRGRGLILPDTGDERRLRILPLEPRRAMQTVPLPDPPGVRALPGTRLHTLADEGRWAAACFKVAGLSTKPWQIWRYPLDGGAPQRLVSASLRIEALALSPDGRRLIYWSHNQHEAHQTLIR